MCPAGMPWATHLDGQIPEQLAPLCTHYPALVLPLLSRRDNRGGSGRYDDRDRRRDERDGGRRYDSGRQRYDDREQRRSRSRSRQARVFLGVVEACSASATAGSPAAMQPPLTLTGHSHCLVTPAGTGSAVAAVMRATCSGKEASFKRRCCCLGLLLPVPQLPQHCWAAALFDPPASPQLPVLLSGSVRRPSTPTQTRSGRHTADRRAESSSAVVQSDAALRRIVLLLWTLPRASARGAVFPAAPVVLTCLTLCCTCDPMCGLTRLCSPVNLTVTGKHKSQRLKASPLRCCRAQLLQRQEVAARLRLHLLPESF